MNAAFFSQWNNFMIYDTLDRACCHKRELILRMCDAMLNWLRANRAELEELQELYSELRLEVYNRTSLHRD